MRFAIKAACKLWDIESKEYPILTTNTLDISTINHLLFFLTKAKYPAQIQADKTAQIMYTKETLALFLSTVLQPERLNNKNNKKGMLTINFFIISPFMYNPTLLGWGHSWLYILILT